MLTHFALKEHKDLHNMCKFDQYLHTLCKSGTNIYAICVNLTNVYALCVKWAQRLTEYEKIWPLIANFA